MKKGSEAWGIGIAIFLSHEEIFASEDILLYILLSENMEVKIVSGYEKNNTYSLVLNTPKSDFITPTEEKIYILDVKEKRDIISEYNLNVIFMVYSGSPTVTVSFDENFSDEKVLPNYRIYSTFSYLITPALRK